MITIHTEECGRSKWLSRPLYRVRMESPVGHLDMTNLSSDKAWEFIHGIVQKLISEERPFKISGVRVL